MAGPGTCVVVGAGLAAAKAVEALRANGDDAPVVVVGEERHAPYERPDLSKGYLAGITARADLDALAPGWYADHDVELRLGQAVTGCELATRRLKLADGSTLGYDRLLLATGSAVRRLAVEGAGLDGVHHLRSVEESDALRAAIGAGGPLVVVGGGWIGLEVAAVARGAGLDVTVLQHGPAPLHGVMGDTVGGLWADLHRAHGTTVRTGTGVRALRGEGHVEAVVTDAGDVLDAAAVVVGVGIVPRTEVARSAGLEIDDGVVTDGRLRTSDPHVWAAGDVASAWNGWAGRRLRVEHWANAKDQGAFAGRSLAGVGDEWRRPPFFFSDQYDAGMEYRGWADPAEAEVVVRGDAPEGTWFAFWLGDGAVRAAMHVNGWDDAEVLGRMVEAKAVVRPEALADPGTELASLLR